MAARTRLTGKRAAVVRAAMDVLRRKTSALGAARHAYLFQECQLMQAVAEAQAAVTAAIREGAAEIGVDVDKQKWAMDVTTLEFKRDV